MDEAEKQIGGSIAEHEVTITVNLEGNFTEKINEAIKAMKEFTEVTEAFQPNTETFGDVIVAAVREATSRGNKP